jgi:glyoxylase-like metal-dependent hydrolase (beta-lactamase superfamily II)
MKSFDGEIEVVEINDHLAYFYWGRHPDHKMMDMQLGGGSFAIYKGSSAIVVDTMTQPGQGLWVKQYLEKTHAIKFFTVVNTHWHVDHIIDNGLYRDCTIVGHTYTRKIMLENQKAFETGNYEDYPAFSVVPPNLTFEGRLDLWLDDIKVELHEVLVHAKGQIGVILPKEKIFIASDILEDPIWFFDFDIASPETQLGEFERLMRMDIEKILPSHGSLDIIKAGGYNKNLIKNNADYLKQMIGDKDNPALLARSARDYIGEALKAGELRWWEPYAKVHELNKDAIKKLG